MSVWNVDYADNSELLSVSRSSRTVLVRRAVLHPLSAPSAGQLEEIRNKNKNNNEQEKKKMDEGISEAPRVRIPVS